MDKKDSLISFLVQQKDKAKKFTKPFIKRNERDVELYDNNHVVNATSILSTSGDVTTAYKALAESRYNTTDRMIFTNTEGAKASLFDRLPELVIRTRNKDGDTKKQIIIGVYEYMKDKLKLYNWANDALHWFVLSGMVVNFVDYKVETHEAQAYDEKTGEPIFDEFGESVTYTKYDYDDPVLKLGDPKKTYFSPASKYGDGTDGIPYIIREENLSIDVIKSVYDEVVEADVKEDTSDEDSKDGDMARTWFFQGVVPSKFKDLVENWEVDAIYYIVFTSKKVLFTTRRKRKQAQLGRWYAQPNKFFGFGFGTIGEPYQLAKEQRKGQISRAADVSAFAKLAMKNDGKEEEDPELWKDPRENLVVAYSEDKPEYLQPPQIGDSVFKDLQQNESDAQAAFGLLDISNGAQNSTTVKTATGQTIFADAAQRRIKFGRRLYMDFFKSVIIELFKQAQENWTDPKPITITDEDGNTKEIEITKENLANIDFDKDLDIDSENISVNKDVLREQLLALYDKTKDDPIVERKVMLTDVLRRVFGVTNPSRYIKEASEVEPGTPLVNPETGEQFIVGESGEVVSQESQQEMSEPSPDGGRTAQSQASVLNTVGA